ncbi:peptidoglycan-binding protein [Brevundimonas sp.]|uniref:peptidoglycan-binding protein n=1 Tax=Brevundimonas sp. TaxID=1871086 RepID=UPI001A25EBFB|nr:peptidoglycan-binding protein [Brevundimonas sp.]MBJ7485067.1 peptidoglycan-binding protein [Brevundimonas sp.]
MSRILASIDRSSIDRARALLIEAEQAGGHPLGALGAAALAATAAIAMAGVMILGTGIALDQPNAPTEVSETF